jgi:hypothetical protein
VANTLNAFRGGGVGFIDLLDVLGLSRYCKSFGRYVIVFSPPSSWTWPCEIRDSPELQLWAPLAYISIDDPIFVIHELQADLFKLLVAHRSLHCGNDFILLASLLNVVHNNQWR